MGVNKSFGLSGEALSAFEEIRLLLRYSVVDRRVELSMTQAAFGKLVGVPSTSLSNMENRGSSSTGSPTSIDLLLKVLLASGLTRADIAKIIAG